MSPLTGNRKMMDSIAPRFIPPIQTFLYHPHLVKAMASTTFEVIHRDGLARIGKFTTPHGTVTTPTLLPVINPSTISVSVETMKSMGAEMIITNSYIIHSTPNLREKALEHGVHSLVGDIPVMTDSGTFQMYMYGKVKVNNDQIVGFQRDIGSDVGTILDVFTLPESDHEKARGEAEETLERARTGVSLKGEMALAGPVQGGIYPDLREWHARELSALDLDFHPVGGVVPLMENYRYRALSEIIIGAKKGLNPSRPVHLFGAGHPMIFPLAAYLGCDFFDSASYIKYARDDRMMFWNGTRKLQDIHELWCPCPVCSSSSIGEIRSLPDEERARQLALHNLHISFSEIRRIRDAIKYGDLRELVEARLRENPHLLPVFQVLKEHSDYLERFEPVSRRSAFYFAGPESLDRPNVLRYTRRFYSRFMPSRRDDKRIMILLEEGEKPYSRNHRQTIENVRDVTDARFMVNSIFGPVPLELDEMYPLAQTVIPRSLDAGTLDRMNRTMETYSHSLPTGLGIVWDGDGTLEVLEMFTGTDASTSGAGIMAGEVEGTPEGERIEGTIDCAGNERGEKNEIRNESTIKYRDDLARVRAVADMQFGEGARRLIAGDVRIVCSRKTGKIRNVHVNGEHILSMRAHDGLFTLKPAGAKLLQELFPAPRLRVVVEDDEVAEYLRQGKNTFARFVSEMDPGLRPMDEVMVVNSNDELLAIGQVVLVREEALAFSRGIAVKVREGVDGKD